MNYDPPHLLPFAAPVPSSTYPGLTPPYASPSISSFPFLSPFLFLSPLSLFIYLSISLSLSVWFSRIRVPLSSFISVRSPCAQESCPPPSKDYGGLPEGLRSSCRLTGNAVPGVARTLRMVTKGAPPALSLREFPDELPRYLHASEATPGASAMALPERMERYRSVTRPASKDKYHIFN